MDETRIDLLSKAYKTNFRGQYIFGPEIRDLPDEFDVLKIDLNRFLSHHTSLPVSVCSSGTSKTILLGLVFDSKDPIEVLEEVRLYANYTYATNASPVVGASCDINGSIGLACEPDMKTGPMMQNKPMLYRF